MKLLNLCFYFIIISFFVSCSNNKVETGTFENNDNIFQYGTMKKFLDSDYEGSLSIKELKRKGDFGLGTYNGVNGEMVVIDGKVYRILPDGEVFEVPDHDLSPFTVVKFFEPDTSIKLDTNINFQELTKYLSELIADASKPIAIKISGEFESVKTRTVKEQKKPYPSLNDIVAEQIVFDFENIRGSAVGFWFPPYFEPVNFPNYHFHFMKEGISGGGHLLNCRISSVTIEFDYPEELVIGL